LREAIGWYLSIFLWLYFTGIGIPPCPEEAGIGYAAYLAASDAVSWWWAWPVAGAGILCADLTLYGVGRLCGPRLFEYRWVKRMVKPERRQRFERLFHGHGLKILLTARLLPPLRTGIFIMAGALSFSMIQFLIADLIYAVFGVGVLFFFGTGIVSLIHYLDHWLGYLAGGVVVAVLLVHYFRRLRAREVRISNTRLARADYRAVARLRHRGGAGHGPSAACGRTSSRGHAPLGGDHHPAEMMCL
jgi:membrane protein DedA with SNARE-associated domain